MHIYRRRTFLQLSAAAIGAGFTGASAQTPAADGLQQYDIELVIFSRANPTASPEEWAAIETRLIGTPPPADEAPSPSLDAPPPAAPQSVLPTEITNFPPLDTARLKLQNIAAALNRNKSYRLLGHIGWTQPGYPLDTAPKVDISTYLPDAAVTGAIALARGRYLHLNTNLIYQSPEGPRYVLREQRRMQRSGEKHYLDHPYFGVIALVTPRS